MWMVCVCVCVCVCPWTVWIVLQYPYLMIKCIPWNSESGKTKIYARIYEKAYMDIWSYVGAQVKFHAFQTSTLVVGKSYYFIFCVKPYFVCLCTSTRNILNRAWWSVPRSDRLCMHRTGRWVSLGSVATVFDVLVNNTNHIRPDRRGVFWWACMWPVKAQNDSRGIVLLFL
jgi:hypothetical protein